MAWKGITMKSQVKRTKVDQITHRWDHKASPPSNSERKAQYDPDEKRSLEEYFALLDEIRPHLHELKNTKVYDKPFTLP